MKLLLIPFALFLLITHVAAQTTTKPLQVAVIDSYVFEDEKQGVTKLLGAKNKVNAEFKTKSDEFTAQQKKLEDFIKTTQSKGQSNDPAKAEEADRMSRDLKYKQESLQSQFQKRYNEVVNPVYNAMGTAMKQWCKLRGYDVLIDISKDDKAIILWVDDQKINEMTKDLIKHFNTVL